MSSTQPQPGTRIDGRYELQQRVGQGGSGSVWRALHLSLNAPVALKLVNLGERPREIERLQSRFEREAKLAASIRHRNVVSITDYGRETPELAYMVMEYLEGGTLADLLDEGATGQDVLEVMLEALQGLIAVHAAGVVHRDLKPENIALVVDGSGRYPKLVDFGISRHLDRRDGLRSAVTTMEGRVFGTPGYMSPEQARGLADVDQRTDIYSTAVILYEGYAGHLPFQEPNVGDLLMEIVMGQAIPLHELRPDLNPLLCNVIMKAMAKDRVHRFQTAAQLHKALLFAAQQPWPERHGPEGLRVPSAEVTLRLPEVEAVAKTVAKVGPVVGGQSTDSAGVLTRLEGAPPLPANEPSRKRQPSWLAIAVAVASAALLAFAWWLGREPRGTGSEAVMKSGAGPATATATEAATAPATATAPAPAPATAPVTAPVTVTSPATATPAGGTVAQEPLPPRAPRTGNAKPVPPSTAKGSGRLIQELDY